MNPYKPSATIRSLRRLLLANLLSLLAVLSASAAPFRDLPITFTQPDGTQIELRGWGDEFYAVFETLEGYTVVFDHALKAYCYAQRGPGGDLVSSGTPVRPGKAAALGMSRHLREDAAIRQEQVRQRHQRWEAGMETAQRWKERKAALHQLESQPGPGGGGTNSPQPGPPSTPTIGSRLGLTLLIDFDDDPATIPQTDIDRLCNADNYTGYGNNGSVKQYYYDNSNGLLLYSNVVTVYIRIPNSLHPKSYYNDTSKDCGDQANLLIRDAITIMKALPNYTTDILPTFNNLTVDGNNNVIACNVFYTGGNGGVWTFGLWPHSWALYNVGAQSLSTGGKKVFRYQITNIGSSLTIGTFCHENGHMLCGFPDLYDYTGDSSGLGDWCLMSGGNYGGSPAGSNPTQICGYLKRAAGWATTIPLTSSSYLTATVTATAGTNFNHFYRFQKPGVSTEYFLAEGKYKTARDADLPGSGVVVWHIDELGDNSSVNLNPNTTHDNFEATLVQADHLWQLEKGLNSGDANDPYYSGNPASGYVNQLSDTSNPTAHWWSGAASGLKFSSFSARGTTMTFVVGDPPPGANFTASPTIGAAALDVVFTDISVGLITSRSWDFGDGSTLPSTTATNVLHTYTNAGVYSPSLTVFGSSGSSTTNRLDYIVVTNSAPVANFVGNRTSGLAPLTVWFTNTSGGTIDNASWYFGEGGLLSTMDAVVPHSYSNAGTYSVSLTVSGPTGISVTNRVNYIVVSNGPPIADFSASPSAGPAPLAVTFLNSSSGRITDVLWAFGDGNTNNTMAPAVTNTYALAGSYSVSLKVTGPFGTGITNRASFIVVTNAAPEPAFAADRNAGRCPLTVSFTNLSAHATDYVWSLGDGATSTNFCVTNTYARAGNYTVCLTATSLGGTRSACSNNFIVVTNPPLPTVQFVAAPATGAVPLTVWFTNLTIEATNYAWSFGDGSATYTPDTSVLNHTYTIASNYTVCLTATGAGGTATTCSNDLILATNSPPNVAVYGNGDFGQCDVPVQVTNAMAVAAGAWHTLALQPDGAVLAWGEDSNGQCDVPPELHDAIAIAAGGYHCLAVRLNGTVVAWGASEDGQANVPASLGGAIGIAAGTWHSVALRADGRVTVWGDNTFGQTNVPAGLTNVSAVAAGGNHTLALKADRTVVAWGENTDAQGNVSGQSVVPWGLSNVVAIAAGDYHSLAVKADGTVVAWGDSSMGQCDVPAGLTNAVAISAGSGHSVALKADGSVAAWGSDWTGQCDLPRTLTPAAGIAAGAYHTAVLLAVNLPSPRLLNPACKGGRFNALLQTLNRKHYTLECNSSLAAPNWTALSTNLGNGALEILTDSTATGAQRFYRVRQW